MPSVACSATSIEAATTNVGARHIEQAIDAGDHVVGLGLIGTPFGPPDGF